MAKADSLFDVCPITETVCMCSMVGNCITKCQCGLEANYVRQFICIKLASNVTTVNDSNKPVLCILTAESFFVTWFNIALLQ